MLIDVAERVFVGGVRRQAEFERKLAVLAIGVVAVATVFGGGRGEFRRQAEAVGLRIRGAALDVPVALVAAEIGRGVALAIAAETGAGVTLEGRARLARNQVLISNERQLAELLAGFEVRNSLQRPAGGHAMY